MIPTLSPSRIQTFEKCSWTYYCKYILKLPDKSNDGASRGTCVHILLDSLINPRHKKYFWPVVTAKNIYSVKSIKRLVYKHATKLGVCDEENLRLINIMSLVALQNDFYCKGAIKVENEKDFTFSNLHPKYSVKGIIDKIAHYDGKIQIVDYKTSKAKFSDVDENMQTLMYALIVYKVYKIIPDFKFLFLKFPKDPIQSPIKPTEEVLLGLEQYLAYLCDYLSDFSPQKGEANLAAHGENKWLCGKEGLKKDGSPNFICPFRKPFIYFTLNDKDGKVLKASMVNDLHAQDGQSICIVEYNGCPAFKESEAKEDFF